MTRLRLNDAVLDSDHVLREAGNEGRNEAFIKRVQSLIPRVSPEARQEVWDWCSDAQSRINESALPVISLVSILGDDQDVKNELLEAFPTIADYVEEYTPKPGDVVETQPPSEERVVVIDTIDSERNQTRRGALKAIYSTVPPDRASA
ncbi:MAG: hypothetical protein R3B71_01420 [Candidatus Gracilibacteria bacterium]